MAATTVTSTYTPNQFNGLRKATLSWKASGGTTRTSVVIIGNKVGLDGIEMSIDPIEQSEESYTATVTHPVGVEIKAATLNIIPFSVSDIAGVLGDGYDPTTGSWNLFADGCNVSDVTLAFERVCPNPDGTHGANLIFRHVTVSNAINLNLKRATTSTLALKFYPQLALASDYGLTGANSGRMQAMQLYNGIYDPTTDEITYDTVSGS